jgi:DNA-binding IclR family transcriptional regulator
MEKENSEVYPPAVVRAIEILDFLAANKFPLSIKELSEKMGIPHASAYRIVKCLLDYGYLRIPPNQTEKYKLGYKFSFLSKMAFDGADLISIVAPYFKELAQKTDQACQLCVLNDGHVITLDQALPHDAITIIAKLGEPVPINVSASGKVLLSRLPEHKCRDILEKVWPTFRQNTAHTVMDMDVFLQQIRETSKLAYATDIEEFALGIGCLAVPVYDYSDQAIAAIGLTGPIENYRDPETFDMMLNALLAASKSISQELYI